MKIWFSGYTTNLSRGIYRAQLDDENHQARVTDVTLMTEVSGPTYLRVTNDLLFTIAKKENLGGIVSYQQKKFKQPISAMMTPGASPCYIGINEAAHRLYTANYHTGLLSVYHYDANGELQLLVKTKHADKRLGPRPEQETAHPHFFDETPDHHLVSCDLGTDTVDFYEFDKNSLTHLAKYEMAPGFGTRHLVFDSASSLMYIVGELSSQISVVHYDEKNWTFEALQTIKTIPEHFSKHNGAAALRLSKDGRFIYVSNRGYDSIAVFATSPEGKLKLIQQISTFGTFPRDFNWDSDEHYVIAANQTSNNATLYRRNPETGLLAVIQKDIAVPEATCVAVTKD